VFLQEHFSIFASQPSQVALPIRRSVPAGTLRVLVARSNILGEATESSPLSLERNPSRGTQAKRQSFGQVRQGRGRAKVFLREHFHVLHRLTCDAQHFLIAFEMQPAVCCG
jgi:hypothetical protein